MDINLALFLGLLLVVAPTFGCRVPAVAPRPDASDAGMPVGDAAGDDCSRACANIARIGCPEGVDARCVDVCRADQARGPQSQLDVQCVVAASSKDQLLVCRVRCRVPGQQ